MSSSSCSKRPDAAAWRLAAYGLLGMPLAMAALPVYVQVASYYSAVRGVGLAQVGWILFAARLFDTLQDPLLGHVIDRLRGGMTRWMALSGLLLALAFAGLWQPPTPVLAASWWLAAMLALAYGAHSMLNIAYLAWGARLPSGAASPAPHCCRRRPGARVRGWRAW